MKLTFIGTGSAFDTDICLIRGLQQLGVEFEYYFKFEKIGPLFKLKKQLPHDIICATDIEEMQIYKEYIDLSNVYMISTAGLRHRNLKFIWLYIRVFLRTLKFNPDFIHFTWPQVKTPSLLYLLPKNVIMTVHDPLPHSSHNDEAMEKARRIGFKRASKLILLNNKTTDEFKKRYNVPDSKIEYSQIGVFDYLDYVKAVDPKIGSKYILFFGQIARYKGVDILLSAMKKVHEIHPDWKLVVAGGGKMYFDISEYEKLDYVEIRNYFIDIPELVGLIKGCEFVVAPYRDATQSGILTNTLSLSKPSIVTNVGNFTDLIKNNMNGLVVPPENEDSLVDAICKMIESPELRYKMSENIKSGWRQEFDNTPINTHLLEIYKRLIVE